MFPVGKKEYILNFLKHFKTISEQKGVTLKPENLSLKILPFSEDFIYIIEHIKPYEVSDSLDTLKYQQISEEIESNPLYERIRVEKLKPSINIGEKFVPIDLMNLTTQQAVKISHQKDQILILDFWATWCSPCISAMLHNYKIIESNFDKWNGKVKFITASLVEDAEEVNYFVKKANWNKFDSVIDHYIVKGESDLNSLYGVNFIPHVVVVDKDGVVRNLGNPSLFGLEETINKLLEEDLQIKGKSEEDKSTTQSIQKQENIVKIFEFINSYKKELTTGSKLQYNPNILLNYVIDAKIASDWNDINLHVTEVDLKVELRHKEYYDFLQKFNNNFPEYKNYTWLITVFKILNTFEIKPSTHCDKCNYEFQSKDGQYYCFWCNISYCEYCTESLNQETGFNKLVHKEHNLCYFKTKDPEKLKNLDAYKLGNNLFVNAKEENLFNSHSASCNKCGESVVNSARFICITCRPGAMSPGGLCDYCFDCIKTLREGNVDSQLETSTNTNEDKHEHDSHVYLRLMFETNDYFNY